MKLRIEKDEWYPFYMEVSKTSCLVDLELEVSEAFYARFKAATLEMHEVHNMISAMEDEQEKAEDARTLKIHNEGLRALKELEDVT